MSNIDDLKSMATHSDFTCPECGGGLWHVKNDPVNRYRCHTGHVYTENLLRKSQHHQIEESIWVSIRMLEEKANLFKVMASRHPEDSRRNVNYHQRADDIDGHVKRLKILLHDLAEHSPANDIEE